MATIDIGRNGGGHGVLDDILQALHAGVRAFHERREARRAILAIGRLGPHLIRDAGFDPDELHSVVKGWDDLDPVGFRILLPKDGYLNTAQGRRAI